MVGSDGNLRAERRIGEDQIDLAEQFSLAQTFFPSRRTGQRIGLIQAACPVVVHDHVHLAGLDEVGIEVEADDATAGILRNAIADFRLGTLHIAFPALDFGGAGFLDDAVHCGNQEAARAAGWIERELAFFRFQHGHGHVADIARGEEFAAVASQVRADDFFVGMAFDVDIRFQ